MILDIIILAILVFSAFLGYKKGLVGVLVSVIALLLSIILAIFLQGTLADYLSNETNIGSTIESSVKEMMEEQIKENKNEKIDVNEKNKFLEMFFDTEKLTNSAVSEGSKKVTTFILKGISFVAIFVIVFVICYILRMVLNIVFSLPILGSVNKIGGVGVNILKSLFKIWVVLAICSFISFTPKLSFIYDIIDSSILTKFLYNNNIIVIILKSVVKF